MSENLKNGLLVFIAAMLVVNTVLILTNDSSGPYTNPAESKATFERTPTAKTSVNSKKEADMSSVDPLKTASKKPVGPTTSMKFAESSHDFGTIDQGTENKKIFEFTNTGSEPLVIENAKGSCGCTVPEWPKEPIPPGGTGEIKVVYKPGKQKNQQKKNVTITANTQPSKTVLTISANVTPATS
jgi:hypothetical protein